MVDRTARTQQRLGRVARELAGKPYGRRRTTLALRRILEQLDDAADDARALVERAERPSREGISGSGRGDGMVPG